RQASRAPDHRRELRVLRRAPHADSRIDQALAQFLRRGRLDCMPYLQAPIDKAHPQSIPVIHTPRRPPQGHLDHGSWTWKNGRSDEDMTSKPSTNVDGNDIVAEIAPASQDIVVLKQKPSGFFGTNMASYLTLLGCDSVIVTGTTTSGCVRATVLDAFS